MAKTGKDKKDEIKKLLFGSKKLSMRTFSPDNKIIMRSLGLVEKDNTTGEIVPPHGR